MSLWSTPVPIPPPQRRRILLRVLVRITLSVTALFAAYFLIPTRKSGGGEDVPLLVVELLVFGVIVVVQIPAIVKARFPILRAIEALAIIGPVYLLMFARIYLSGSLNDPGAFNEKLDTATALYFTVTTFATVGFGDIVATTDAMRLLVTLQMVLNLVILGAVIRLLVLAARRGVARKGVQLPGDAPVPPTTPTDP